MATDYQKTITTHLADYKSKSSRLKSRPDGTFRPKKYPHILEQTDLKYNLIDDVLISSIVSIQQTNGTPQLVQLSDKKHIHLHQFAHHLNSSQMMCINFFAPLLKPEWQDVLLELTGVPRVEGDSIATYDFEHIENTEEKTNFDFFIKTKQGLKIFFEIKYTEQEFSRTSSAVAASKASRWVKMYQKKVTTNPYYSGLDEAGFYEDYQIYRNLYYAASPSDYVIFVVPRGNQPLTDQLGKHQIGTAFKDNAKILYWEDLVTETLQKVSRNSAMTKYFDEFQAKYNL